MAGYALGMLFDAHTHVFRDGLPLRPARRYAPDYEASPQGLLAELDRYGLRGALLVQPSFLADPDFALAAAAAAPHRLRVVPSPADLGELDAHLEQWLDAGIVGVRLNLVGRPLPDLGHSAWRRAGRALAAAGVHLEIHAQGEQWDELAPVLTSWPSVVVVDHLGRHRKPEILVDLGALDHVWFKASAAYRWPDRDASVRFARNLYESTGGGRLIWGSDRPFTQHEDVTYGGVLEDLRRDLPEVERVSDANLQRLLGSRAFPVDA